MFKLVPMIRFCLQVYGEPVQYVEAHAVTGKGACEMGRHLANGFKLN